MFDQLFQQFESIRVAVVGDIMLDTYWWGNTERISPEAPVPIVALKNKEYRIGGAGNVALNLAKLGAQVSMHSIIGADEDAQLLTQLVEQEGINGQGLVAQANRITTNKIRIISRSQHLLRLDSETTQDLSEETEAMFINHLSSDFARTNPQVVILEDYNKGVLTPRVISAIIQYCNQNGIITAVDPKRKNFFNYQAATIFKPNFKEANEALNLVESQATLEQLSKIHSLLQQKLQHQISLITLSEKGVFLATANDQVIVPAHIRSIADVSGAGDTVIAVASLVYAATGDAFLMAEMSNLAGGLVCEEVGTVALDPQRFLQECNKLLANHPNSQQFDG